MAEHDQSYKQLFSYPRMIEDLLSGFVREDWVQQLNFETSVYNLVEEDRIA